MNTFDNITGFEWDKHNAQKIFLKHNISISEAENIFTDTKFVLSGARLTGKEVRYAIMGTSGKKKLIAVVTVRKGKIRIISARAQSRKEGKIYEEECKNR